MKSNVSAAEAKDVRIERIVRYNEIEDAIFGIRQMSEFTRRQLDDCTAGEDQVYRIEYDDFGLVVWGLAEIGTRIRALEALLEAHTAVELSGPRREEAKADK